MKLFTALHEMAADRISFIQYPNIRGPKPIFFANEMSWPVRIALVAGSLIACAAALAAMGWILFWVYVFFIK